MRRRSLPILALLFVVNAALFAVAALLQNVPAILTVLGVTGLSTYWFYIRYYRRERPRSLAPLGEGDIYFPRTNIPRPMYDDPRIKQEKRRFAKLDKTLRKIKRKNS